MVIAAAVAERLVTLQWTPSTTSRVLFRSSIQDDRFGFMFNFPARHRWQPGAKFRSGSTPADLEADLRRAAERWNARLFGSPTIEGTLPAATTFLGQFIAHDLSFDARAALHSTREPIANLRTPRFDLDSLYGGGPAATPQYFQSADRRLFAIGSNAGSTGSRKSRPELDLLRSPDASADWELTDPMSRRRTAVIPDPRNDENILVGQLHLAFQLFHNRIVRETNCSFEDARYAVRHAYHGIILRDFLIPVCGSEIMNELHHGEQGSRFRHFRRRGFVPYEFAMALFRFGHSMVGESYHLNDDLESSRQGKAIRFAREDLDDDRSRDRMAHSHLDGGRVLPLRWTVQWDRLLHSPSRPPGSREPNDAGGMQKAQSIDLRISPPLSGLPLEVETPIERSLPYRTLLRGSQIGLPTGAWVAERVVGSRAVLPSVYVDEPDPLWIYILREAALCPVSGGQLGPVGARLVAEVCYGLLLNDPTHGLAPSSPAPVFSLGLEPGLVQLIEFAGLPISRADWMRYVGVEGR